MNEAQFLERWKNEKPIYEAWAYFISEKIHEQLLTKIAPVPLDYFIKVPVKPRLKADSTLVDKALYRKKYESPYDDVTDKVGMRFVVLLTSDIRTICSVIDGGVVAGWWEASKDRDYEQERLAKPLEFSYQSVHYVLRAKDGIECNGIKIPGGTPCEVQVRTLLQHAHSELTHDTLYKPKTTAQPEVKRTVAKSMALIEATDEFFEQAMKNLDEASRTQRQLLEFLVKSYEQGVGQKAGTERSNQLLIDTYIDLVPQAPFTEISEYLNAKGFIFDKIKEQLGVRHFFGQPAILLAYYLADDRPAQMQGLWPMDSADLAKIFSDLGKKYED
ncbi:GTP pyrophosphokinase [Cupriavidus campinensis]|uniref:GTP pyrophosphokinase n=1 Tax=Cupriavidus campinensis TaxID=151783 RepID=UPI0011ED7ECE|nr:RelA/SpoT domain-containing protein [Cupriavidus campinensis]